MAQPLYREGAVLPAPGPAGFGHGQSLACRSWGTHGLCLFLYGKEFPLRSWLCLAAPGSTRRTRSSWVEPYPAACFGHVCDARASLPITQLLFYEGNMKKTDLPDSSYCCVPQNLKKLQEEITAEEFSPSTTLFFKLYLYLRATCYFP